MIQGAVTPVKHCCVALLCCWNVLEQSAKHLVHPGVLQVVHRQIFNDLLLHCM